MERRTDIRVCAGVYQGVDGLYIQMVKYLNYYVSTQEEIVEEGLISRKEAVHRVKPEKVDFFLHPQLDSRAIKDAKKIASGLNVSPGAAVGMVAFDADTAERWAKQEEKKVIMVRPETKPDDVNACLPQRGSLPAKGPYQPRSPDRVSVRQAHGDRSQCTGTRPGRTKNGGRRRHH